MLYIAIRGGCDGADMGFSLTSSAGASSGPQKLAFGFGAKTKPPKLAAFAQDSDDDEEPAKRRRRDTADAGAARPPGELEVRKAADKLAEYVAANGRSFEEVTRQRNRDKASPFRFLLDKSSADYAYYDSKVRQLERAKSAHSVLGATAASPVEPPASTAVQAVNSHPSFGGESATGGHEEPKYTAAAASAADSLAAMQRFERMAAEREREAAAKRSAQDDDTDAERPPAEFLNETAYDRRKQMAVYKRDGTRAHHLNDYIPPEELVNFYAKSGKQEAVQAAEQQQRIDDRNVGHKLLSKMGWREGEGLGASGSGISAPVSALGASARTNLGLGAKDSSDPSTATDDFELFRARMQLGYKYRPNPNGNPRREYHK